MNLWNIKCLEPPPITTYKTNSYADIQKLRSHFEKALDIFNSQSILHQEAALLSRCIYRMKMKFRSDKGLKAMEKLNRALLQFNYLNIPGILDDFHSLLPKEKSTDLYLPTRNMLEFILVRLQSVSLLMQRAVEVAKDAACLMGSRICIGHFWKVALIMLGVVSRIWVICRKILKTSCDFYNNILPMRKVLQNVSKDWLPDNYIFPNSMEQILEIDFNSSNDEPQWDLFKSIVPVSEIIENLYKGGDEFVEVMNEDIDRNLDDNQQLNNNINRYRRINAFELLTTDEDLGVVVSESTKHTKNVISILSDSEDSISATNQTSSNNSKMKQNVTNKNNLNISGKRKKNMKGNKKKNKEKIFNDGAAIVIENDDIENVEMIEIQGSEEKCVDNKQIKQTKNAINISSDSEDSISATNQISYNNSKMKQNVTNINNLNITGKRKKNVKGNKKKNKGKIFNAEVAIEIENDDSENVEMIEIEGSEEKCVENKQIHKKDKHLLNISKVNGKKKKIKSKCNIIENISSLKELKIFIKNESKCRDKQNITGVLRKLDKLQWTMLRKHIKKLTTRANNKLITDYQCLTDVKRVLKASLEN